MKKAPVQRRANQVYDANSYMRGVHRSRWRYARGQYRLGDRTQSATRSLLPVQCDSPVGRIQCRGGTTRQLVAELGELAARRCVWPSSPAGRADRRYGRVPAAGNPVSCRRLRFFAGRAIRGRLPDWSHRTRRCAVARIVSAGAWTIAVRLVVPGRPIALQRASILSSTTRADGFVIVPAEAGLRPETVPIRVADANVHRTYREKRAIGSGQTQLLTSSLGQATIRFREHLRLAAAGSRSSRKHRVLAEDVLAKWTFQASTLNVDGSPCRRRTPLAQWRERRERCG
jgi:hypothetical protein